jgi:hypothetical protein
MSPDEALRKIEHLLDELLSVAMWQYQRSLCAAGVSAADVEALIEEHMDRLATWRAHNHRRMATLLEHGADLH